MMKKFALTLAVFAACVAPQAQARDTVLHIPLADVLAMPEAQSKLDGSVKFFLAEQATPKVLETLGGDTAHDQTNGVGKSDDFGCKWAALSSLIKLQNKAKQAGANAVVDITSGRSGFKDGTNFECNAGAIIIRVAIKGTYAKIAD